MDSGGEPGVFLTLDDCIVLYPGLKERELSLSAGERKLMSGIEKVLYSSLSIREMEELLKRGNGNVR
ncbi:MAG: hypothetical protein FWC45_08120 [Treponema sp.]|nr:hypothetical protein [Treponema sp.]